MGFHLSGLISNPPLLSIRYSSLFYSLSLMNTKINLSFFITAKLIKKIFFSAKERLIEVKRD